MLFVRSKNHRKRGYVSGSLAAKICTGTVNNPTCENVLGRTEGSLPPSSPPKEKVPAPIMENAVALPRCITRTSMPPAQLERNM